ncbi:MAG: hypothetical protein V4684_19485 [Pseudomonadota bacterium]
MNNPTDTPDYAPLDDAEYRRQARLLRALHCAYPVMHKGKLQFIQAVHASLAGGRIDMDIFLTGNPAIIDSKEITLPEKQV